jgi:hypothetical protein
MIRGNGPMDFTGHDSPKYGSSPSSIDRVLYCMYAACYSFTTNFYELCYKYAVTDTSKQDIPDDVLCLKQKAVARNRAKFVILQPINRAHILILSVIDDRNQKQKRHERIHKTIEAHISLPNKSTNNNRHHGKYY